MRSLSLFLCILSLACTPLAAQSEYAIPKAKIIRNQDGTVLSLKVAPEEQRVEEILKDAAGNILWRLIRELDEEFQPVTGVKFDGVDQIVSRHKYLCLRGRVEEEEIFDSRNRFLARMVYDYDSKGRLIRIDQFDAQGALVYSSKATGIPVDGVTVRKDSTR